MIETLVSIVIVSIGLLGVAGIQSRMQVAEVEAHQRAQAIILLQEMVDRVNSNRKAVAEYVTGTPAGVGNDLDCTAPATIAANDLCEWSQSLEGAAETLGGEGAGAMAGARGCISNPVVIMPREVMVTVAWQGTVPTMAPDPSVTCGQGQYGDEKTRRVLMARIRIGCLQNDPTTGACVTP